MRYAKDVVELAQFLYSTQIEKDGSVLEECALTSINQARVFYSVVAKDPDLADFDRDYPPLSLAELNLGDEPEMPDFMRGKE